LEAESVEKSRQREANSRKWPLTYKGRVFAVILIGCAVFWYGVYRLLAG